MPAFSSLTLSLHGVICQFHFIYFYSFYLLLSEKMFFFYTPLAFSYVHSAFNAIRPVLYIVEREVRRTRSFLMMMTLLSSFAFNKKQSAISWNGTQNFNKYFFHFVYFELRCKLRQPWKFWKFFESKLIKMETSARAIILVIYDNWISTLCEHRKDNQKRFFCSGSCAIFNSFSQIAHFNTNHIWYETNSVFIKAE